MSFETTLAALGTAALIGLVSGWMSRPTNKSRIFSTDVGCAGVFLACLAILFATGMLLGKALL